MCFRTIRWALFAVLSGAFTQALPVSAAPGDVYTLDVKLTDVDSSSSEHHLTILPETPFQFVKIGQPTRTTVSGVLHEPKQDRYPLELSIVAWDPAGAPTNFKQNWTLELELGKSQPVTVPQSNVFHANVELKKDVAASPVPQ